MISNLDLVNEATLEPTIISDMNKSRVVEATERFLLDFAYEPQAPSCSVFTKAGPLPSEHVPHRASGVAETPSSSCSCVQDDLGECT
jgi:predicted HAD superfamily phosphohydrolase YqeG